MGIRAGTVLAALVLAAAASAATAKAPSVSLASARSGAVPGRAWAAVLVVRGARPRAVTLSSVSGRRRVAATARRWQGDRYRARLTFPVAGRWSLSARIGAKRFRLGTIVVRAPARPPVLLVYPAEAILEPSGSLLVSESGQRRIARVDPSTGRVTTVLSVVQPYGLALSPAGVLYTTSESRVVRVGSGGSTTTLADAGEDVGPIALDGAGNLFFSTVSRIFRIDGATGAVTHYAGTGVRGGGGDGGPALQAELDAPHGLAFGADGALYLGDTGNDRVRRIDPVTRVITTAATGNEPVGLAVAPDGSLLFAERVGLRVSRVDGSGTKTLVAGTGVRGNTGDGGPATAARLDEPFDVVPAAGGVLYVLQSGAAGGLRRIDSAGRITTVRRR